MYPVRRQISPHASALRRNATDVEKSLWSPLRNRQMQGFKFRRQATIGPYVVDFLCIEAALVIELDGGQHDPAIDAPRTAFLEGRGLKVVRYWNHEVAENLDGVLENIAAILAERSK